MSDFPPQRLFMIMLLLYTTFPTIAVGAFSIPRGVKVKYSPSFTPRSLSVLDLFSGRKKGVNTLSNDDDSANSARAGMVKRKIKRLNWLSTPKSRGSYKINKTKHNSPNAGKNEDRHGWKNKSKNSYPVSKRGKMVYHWRGFKQKIRHLIYRNTVYVLQCENGKYYIGSTRNRKQRYSQHFENPRGGSKWTRKYKPIKVIAEYKRIPNRYLMGTESQKTAEYMMKFGINNVRGASYCSMREFTTADILDLTGFLGHHNQLDYQDLKRELWRTLPRAGADPSMSFMMPSTKKNYRKGIEDDDDYINDKEITSTVRRQSSRSKRRKGRKKRQSKFRRQNNEWSSDASDGNLDNITILNRVEIPPRPPRIARRTNNSSTDKPSAEKAEDLVVEEGENTKAGGNEIDIIWKEKEF